MLTKEQAARALGMKVREIREVQPAGDAGHVITTHDGKRSLLAPTGQIQPAPDTAVEPVPATVDVLALAAQASDEDLAAVGLQRIPSDPDTTVTPARRRPSKKTPAPSTPDSADRSGDAAEATVGEAPDGDVLTVPDGDVLTMLAWVGSDQSRAAAALAAEADRGEQRAELVTALQELVG